jgi:hypothetical protein
MPRPWRRHAIPLLALWLLALLAYANSFRAGLVFDNRYVIGQDPRIRQATAENVHLILTKDYWYRSSTSTLYRPITTFSYLFNYAVLGNGASPASYHWVNFVLHAVNIALVYLLGWLLLAEFWPAFAMAAIWAAHPLLTESVTNVVGRADLLAAFGVLAGLLCYARSLAESGRRAVQWRLALVAVTAIGIFSKESGVVVVAAVFLYDIAYCRSVPRRSRTLGYLAMLLPVASFLVVRSHLTAQWPSSETAFTDNPLVGTDFWTARLTAVKVMGKYIGLLLWPDHLSCDYSYNQIPLFTWRFNRWEDWKALIALAVCAGAATVALICYRRSKAVFFFIGFFFAGLAPTANLVILIGTIMAERFLYLPAIGFAGCLACTGWAVYRRFRMRWPAARIAAQVALAVVCLGLGGRTFARNADWFDEQSLWLNAAQSTPNSYKTLKNAASVLAAPPAIALDRAIADIERSLAIVERLPDEQNVTAAYATAGFCYRAKGDSLGQNGGTAWYRKSLEVLLVGRRVDLAFFQAMSSQNAREGKTLALTGWSPLYLELGRTYRTLGEFQNSLEAFAHGRLIDPQIQFFEEMATTYRAMGDPQQAAVSLLEGITMGSGDQVRLAAEVMDLYRQSAPQSCALAGNGNSATLNFDCPLVRSQLCTAGRNVVVLYHQLHRDRDAIATRNSAVNSLGCPAELFR